MSGSCTAGLEREPVGRNDVRDDEPRVERGEIPRARADHCSGNGGRSRCHGVAVDLPLLRPAGAPNRMRVNGVLGLHAGPDLAPGRNARTVEVEPEPGAGHSGAFGKRIEWEANRHATLCRRRRRLAAERCRPDSTARPSRTPVAPEADTDALMDARTKEPPVAGAGRRTRRAGTDRREGACPESCAAKARGGDAQGAEFVPAYALVDTGAGRNRLSCLPQGVTDCRDRHGEAISAVLRAAEDHRHDTALGIDDRPSALPRLDLAPQRDDAA